MGATTATYTVVGMTCGHCVSSVTEEVSAVAGVSEVQVDLATGAMVVTAPGGVDDSAVRGAVVEAGYEVSP